jgi:hypothetical protein
VLASLWPSLCTDDRRALRLCSTTMRDAVDAQAGCVDACVDECAAELSILCPTTVARLAGVHTTTLRSMACLRRMLLVAPAGAVFPRLQSLRLYLEVGTAMHARSRLMCHARSMRA